jgi:hypothetical protein
MWYNGAATILTENLGIMGQTTDSVAVNTKGARPGAAMRMRRRRARRRAGYRCLTIEIHDTEIDALVHRGLLGVDERDQEGAVIDALSDYIERTLGSPL